MAGMSAEEALRIGHDSASGQKPATNEQLDTIRGDVDLHGAYVQGADKARDEAGLPPEPGGVKPKV